MVRRDAGREELLGIYLNDHLMGSAAGVRLAKRCARHGRDTDAGPSLDGVRRDIVEDRDTLEDIIARLGIPTNRLKPVAGAIGEAFTRLKLNGRLLGFSDLSRLVELETLHGGVEMKRRLWFALKEAAGVDPRLDEEELDRLIVRATSQLERIEHHRRAAAARAFAPA